MVILADAISQEECPMNTHVRTLLAGVAVVVPLALGDVSLGAQSAQHLQPTVSVLQDWQREQVGWGNADVRMSRELEDALREHGFRSDRLSTAQTRALDATFRQLFPEQDARRYRLNRTQASALVYMALVQPRDSRYGSTPGRSVCDDLGSLVRRMNDDFLRDNRNRSRYLDQRERDVLLRDARDVEQAARRCDHRSAEDEARTLVRIASQRTVEREQAIRQIQRLQGIVRTASRW